MTRFGNVWSLQYGQTTTSKTACTHFKHYSCMLHSWNNLISLASERRFLCNPFILTNGMAFIVSHYAYLAFPFLSDEWRKLDSKARTLRGVPSTAAAMLFFFSFTLVSSLSPNPNETVFPWDIPGLRLSLKMVGQDHPSILDEMSRPWPRLKSVGCRELNVYNEDERKQICLYPFSQLSRLLMDV